LHTGYQIFISIIQKHNEIGLRKLSI
jgi:hypothetical protein